MKKSTQHLVAWLMLFSLLFAMTSPVMAANIKMDFQTSASGMHSTKATTTTHSLTSAVKQSPCCDHDCHCKTPDSDCASDSCECAIGGSNAATLTCIHANLPPIHGDIPQHSHFAVLTCSTQPDLPPPSFS